MLLNPFCPLTTAKVLALKATVLLLLTLLIKAKVQIVAGSALGIALLLLQALVFLAVSGWPGAGGRRSDALRHAAAPARSGLRPLQVVGGPGAGRLITESIPANNEP